MYSFTKHVQTVVDKAKTKINVLKSIASSPWGQDKETLSMTYKSICRNIIEYAAPIWSPIISDNSLRKLQSLQNQALRLITGNLKMASDLHREAKILPIRDHCKMISNQFLLSNFINNHPGQKLTIKPLTSSGKKFARSK